MAKISNLTELTTATDTSEIVINDGTPTTKKITIANLKTSLGVNYTKLVCLITQSGTDAPTLTILENTTGATFSTVRQAQGIYQITTLSTVFTANKTAAVFNLGSINGSSTWNRLSDTFFQIETGTTGSNLDGFLTNGYLEIRIYS